MLNLNYFRKYGHETEADGYEILPGDPCKMLRRIGICDSLFGYPFFYVRFQEV